MPLNSTPFFKFPVESYGECKGSCKMPGTVCLVTALFEQGWHGQEICMCNGKLAGDPDRTGCRHPKGSCQRINYQCHIPALRLKNTY